MHRLLVSFFLCLTIFFTQTAGASKPKQFPRDEHTYIPQQDTGMRPYLATSLYQTNQLVLTYDDGPHPTRTDKILDLLAEYDVKATFFVVTEKITEQTMPIIQRMLREGHILASHDHDHDDNNSEGEAIYRRELTQTISKVEEILSREGVHQQHMYYRFPYGAYGQNANYHHFNVMKEVSQILYGENCINFVFWDIDTADWVPTIKASQVAQNVRANMEGGTAYSFRRVDGAYVTKPYTIKNPSRGGVVLMHDVQEKTLAASRLILEDARAKGWSIVPLQNVKEYAYENRQCQLISR
jgi:peptidoglycan/xylan/chitin deacetylase (PgdA/CDA1 family)